MDRNTAAHGEADLDEWAIVDDQAEIVASVSTSAPNDDIERTISEYAPAEENAPLEPKAPVAQSVDETAEGEAQNTALDTTATVTADISTEATTAVPDGCVRVRLRVGEHIRPAWCRATQIVDDFVAEFFADAVADGKKIRLIYMGMLLIHDRAMGEYGIEDDGVVHCVITEAMPTPHPQASQTLNLKGLANPANALFVATGTGLYGLWVLLYHYPHLFSWKTIAVLSAFSAAHVSTAVVRFTAAA